MSWIWFSQCAPLVLLVIYSYSATSTTATTTKHPLFRSEVTTKSSRTTGNEAKFSIPAGYNSETRPIPHNEQATEVLFDIHIVAINPIKAADMDFRMDMTLSQRWTDERLIFGDEWFHDNRDFFILPQEFTDKIWVPDPYIVNAKSTDVGQLTQKLVTVYIFKNRTIHYTANLFATVACAMNYKYYPWDYQVCPMFIESFSYDESQVKYSWASESAFTINRKLRMLQFVVTRPLHYHEASVPRYLEDKNFTQLIACFRFDRLLGNHLIQTFAPCSLIVCLSWFSFWLELNALSARMSLVVTSILTLVTQFVGLRADLPPVAYIKAIDIWMGGCMIWVFGALGEYVLVKVIYSMTEDAKFLYALDMSASNMRKKDQDVLKTGDRQLSNEDDSPTQTNPRRRVSTMDFRPNSSMSTAYCGNDDDRNIIGNFRARSPSLNSVRLDKGLGKLRLPLQWIDPKSGRQKLLWKKIDNICKWAFPLTFCIFCGVYWMLLYAHYRANVVQPFSSLIDLNRTSCND
ncbi:Glycine receptor subunit alpha-3 [Orchesella cincta]|uniref:Glycine receptor subunit alpha-3 n=1 Tax=Orchesella cincta TaxID=48709 RepID=A0A1D2NFT5_ORCCI|nr:Glycine receptor subunit alpha-3 [Orchesella cincta]